MDGIPRKIWETGIDPKFSVEEHFVHHDMRDGSFLVGRIEWHGDYYESLVSVTSTYFVGISNRL